MNLRALQVVQISDVSEVLADHVLRDERDDWLLLIELNLVDTEQLDKKWVRILRHKAHVVDENTILLIEEYLNLLGFHGLYH